MKKKKSFLPLTLSIVFITTALDLLSKYYFESRLALGESISIIGDKFLRFTLAHNLGFSFSMLANHPNFVYWAIGSLGLVLGIIFTYYSSKFFKSSLLKFKFMAWGYAFIAGGAFGNALDRFYNGYVVDFVHFTFGNWSFAIFNVADIFINLGVYALIISFFLSDKRPSQRK